MDDDHLYRLELVRGEERSQQRLLLEESPTLINVPGREDDGRCDHTYQKPEAFKQKIMMKS